MSRRRIIGVQRDRAARYLVVTIAAFAVTVAGTRWYLELAGYPMVGGGDLHVAHALWGGLALLIAALLPLLWVGRRSLLLSALLAGVGVGLFIDEVGKFLTTSTDYFFAPAAPIIYGSLLLLALLWLFVRRRRTDTLDATHAAIEALRDGVDGRLTLEDRERIRSLAGSDDDLDPDGFEAQLLALLELPAMDQRLASAGPVARGEVRRWLERLLPTRLERWLVYLGLVMAVAGAVVAMLAVIGLQYEPDGLDTSLIDAGRLEIPDDPAWIILLLVINVAVGASAIVALGLRLRGSRRWLDAALVSVLIDLVVGELVAFYAIQFLALSSTFWGVVLLGLTIDLRIRGANASVDDESSPA